MLSSIYTDFLDYCKIIVKFLLELQLSCGQHCTDSFIELLLFHAFWWTSIWPYIYLSYAISLYLGTSDIIVTESLFYYSYVRLIDLIYRSHVYIVWIIPFKCLEFYVSGFLICSLRIYMTFSFGNLWDFNWLYMRISTGARFIGALYLEPLYPNEE